MEIQSVRRDSAKVEAGEWVGDIPDMGDLRLRVRGLTSTTYLTAMSRLARGVPRKDRERDGSLKPGDALRVMGQAIAETVLFDWDGLTSDGEPLPYDKARATEWLTNPDYRQFLDACVWAAKVVDEGRAETAEDLEKN